MNNPKAQFQVNNGAGWETIAEADIINGIVKPPNAWTMVRAMQKRISYTGYTPIEITIAPEKDDPMEHIIKLKRIEPPEKIILDATEYYTLLSLLGDQIIKNMKLAEAEDLGKHELAGMEYLKTLHKKLLPYQIRGHVELRLTEEQSNATR
jgi:hypothetical protein